MQEKTSNTRQQVCWKMKDTSDQNRDEWCWQCYAVLDPSLWISGVLYGVFVSGLHGLVRLPVHPRWSCSLQLHACFNLQFSCFCSVLAVVQIFLVTCPSPSLFRFTFRNFASMCELHFLNSKVWKIIFYNNIICFCLETQEMYQKRNIISY